MRRRYWKELLLNKFAISILIVLALLFFSVINLLSGTYQSDSLSFGFEEIIAKQDNKQQQQQESASQPGKLQNTYGSSNNNASSPITTATIKDDGGVVPIQSFEQAVLQRLHEGKTLSQKQYLKPIVAMCSVSGASNLQFLDMFFPSGWTKVEWNLKTMAELPVPGSRPGVFVWTRDGGMKKECTEHPWYQLAVLSRQESPKLDNLPLDDQWVDGVHWPAIATSGMRSLANDRPMFLTPLGEVFWRDAYPAYDHSDLVIFRAKAKPRPGALTYHDVQGISHHFRREKYQDTERSAYETDVGALAWTTSDINQNPYKYDPVTNNKGFCAIFTMNIFKPYYDMDALIRNSFHKLLDEYKPCTKNPKPCPGNDLMSYACMSGYKFSITMDNTFLEGYVSEKVFMGKLAGGVPIYAGAPDVADYVNTDAFVWCPQLSQEWIEEFRDKFLIRNFETKGRVNRLFTMFNETYRPTAETVDKELLLKWAVEYLRPHLQPCVDQIIALDQDDDAYNKIRNAPLVTKPEIMTGYATKGLGLAYQYLTTGQLPPSSTSLSSTLT